MKQTSDMFRHFETAITRRLTGAARGAVARLSAWIKSNLKKYSRVLHLHEIVDPVARHYASWIRNSDTLSPTDKELIRSHISNFACSPIISVVMPIYETPEWALREAIDSVRNQLYPYWELCIADDASKAGHVSALLRQAAASDPRIKCVQRGMNGNVSAASNSALSLATGEYVALMDHDDLIPEHALYEIAAVLEKNPTLDIVYSDEDQIDQKGTRFNPYFKTDWNIDLFLGHNIVSHFGVYRRSLVESVGGFREGLEGSQDYDLALRCADATEDHRIYHIPAILYHWRRNYGSSSFSEKHHERCIAAARRSVADHLDRAGEAGKVIAHPDLPDWNRVIRYVPEPVPLVSLIVPTRDRPDLLAVCIAGLLERTDYPRLEILIVDNESQSPRTLELFERLERDGRVRVLKYPGPFNYSAINNMAAAEAKGSVLGLINNDIDVIHADWLSEMVSLAILPGVAAVGAKLLYANNRVQHGGIVLGVGGVANSLNLFRRRSDSGYFGRNLLTSSVSAVTGACLIVRKSVFEDLGGLDADNLPVAFNDVDFCLRAKKRGYRNVWTPHAELHHRESSSRGRDTTSKAAERLRRETEYMVAMWGLELANDPFYNDNLSTEVDKCFQLAFPSRREKPWLRRSRNLSINRTENPEAIGHREQND